MRFIAPHTEPSELTIARPTLAPDWKMIPRNVKRAIASRLYIHQCGLCGYCEGSLGELDRHIEHIEPKGGIGGKPARMFDNSNLIASCQGDQRTGQSADSCGHFKDKYIRAKGTYQALDFISSRLAGCDQQFSYLINGKIVPKATLGTPNHAKADYTINAAGLDCTRLQNRRRQLAEKLVRQINRFKNQPAILQQLANHYLGLHSDTNGTPVLLPFYSTRLQRFRP